MLMLDRLESDGHIAKPDLNKEIVDKLEDPATDTPTRVSMMALLGKRNAIEHIELIRRMAVEPSDIQRVAIANLGLIGDPSDAARVKPFLNSSDRLVEMAAYWAIESLRKRHNRRRP